MLEGAAVKLNGLASLNAGLYNGWTGSDANAGDICKPDPLEEK